MGRTARLSGKTICSKVDARQRFSSTRSVGTRLSTHSSSSVCAPRAAPSCRAPGREGAASVRRRAKGRCAGPPAAEAGDTGMCPGSACCCAASPASAAAAASLLGLSVSLNWPSGPACRLTSTSSSPAASGCCGGLAGSAAAGTGTGSAGCTAGGSAGGSAGGPAPCTTSSVSSLSSSDCMHVYERTGHMSSECA